MTIRRTNTVRRITSTVHRRTSTARRRTNMVRRKDSGVDLSPQVLSMDNLRAGGTPNPLARRIKKIKRIKRMARIRRTVRTRRNPEAFWAVFWGEDLATALAMEGMAVATDNLTADTASNPATPSHPRIKSTVAVAWAAQVCLPLVALVCWEVCSLPTLSTTLVTVSTAVEISATFDVQSFGHLCVMRMHAGFYLILVYLRLL